MKLISLIGALGLGAASAVGVAACGSNNAASVSLPTVTITTPAPLPTGQQTTPTSTTPSTTTTVPSLTTPANATRTAPAPAFTKTTGGTASAGGDLATAEASLARRGYTPVTPQTYDPNQTLRVLIGSSGGKQQAFFFDGTTFLGTDTKLPSRSISVIGQTDTEVTLKYATTSGPATVHFQLDMGRLTPLDTIPSGGARG